MFAVNNKDTRMMSMTMSMFSSVAIVEFEEANVRWNGSFFFGCNFSGISCFLRFVEYPMSVSMDDFLLQHEYISSKILANMAWIFDESFVVLTTLVGRKYVLIVVLDCLALTNLSRKCLPLRCFIILPSVLTIVNPRNR